MRFFQHFQAQYLIFTPITRINLILNLNFIKSLYPALFLSTLHIVLTSVPVFLIGLFEQRVSIKELEKNPLYYRYILDFLIY
jgi:hypothetical protein